MDRRVFLLSVLTGCFRGWPPRDFVEVRGYVYNLSGEVPPLVQDGKLHESVKDPNGVVLTKEQVTTLLRATTGEHRLHPIALCYVPHHGYVFYNAAAGLLAGLRSVSAACSTAFHQRQRPTPSTSMHYAS